MKKKLNCVLLVDDNDSDNFFHKRIIEKSGITDHIHIASNGQEALEFLTTKIEGGQNDNLYYRPALIFLDINMPVMDGWEFVESYRGLPEIQKGEVILTMLTTSLNPVDQDKAEKNLGSGRFIFKPLTLGMVQEIMEKHFPEYL